MPDFDFDDLTEEILPPEMDVRPVTKEDLRELDALERVLLESPKMKHSVDRGKELWVVEDGKLFKRYVPGNELKQYTLADADDDAASGFEAWA